MRSGVFHSSDFVASILVLHGPLHRPSLHHIPHSSSHTNAHTGLSNFRLRTAGPQRRAGTRIPVSNHRRRLLMSLCVDDRVCDELCGRWKRSSRREYLSLCHLECSLTCCSSRIWTTLASVMDCTWVSWSSSSSCIDWRCGECSHGGRNNRLHFFLSISYNRHWLSHHRLRSPTRLPHSLRGFDRIVNKFEIAKMHFVLRPNHAAEGQTRQKSQGGCRASLSPGRGGAFARNEGVDRIPCDARKSLNSARAVLQLR